VAFEPQLIIGVPEKQQRYVLDIINDVQVYIPKRFSVPYPLTIDVKRQFGRKILRLNGWRLI
jgi:nitrogen fixation protein